DRDSFRWCDLLSAAARGRQRRQRHPGFRRHLQRNRELPLERYLVPDQEWSDGILPADTKPQAADLRSPDADEQPVPAKSIFLLLEDRAVSLLFGLAAQHRTYVDQRLRVSRHLPRRGRK